MQSVIIIIIINATLHKHCYSSDVTELMVILLIAYIVLQQTCLFTWALFHAGILWWKCCLWSDTNELLTFDCCWLKKIHCYHVHSSWKIIFVQFGVNAMSPCRKAIEIQRLSGFDNFEITSGLRTCLTRMHDKAQRYYSYPLFFHYKLIFK